MVGPQLRRKPTTSSMGPAAQGRAADAAALAVEVLGRRVNDDIRASASGRCSAGVQKQLSTTSSAPVRASAAMAAMSRPRTAGWTASPGTAAACCRAARRQPATGQQRHEADLDAEGGEVLGKERPGGAEHIPGTDHVIAGLEQRHAGTEDRRHAGGGGHAGLGTLEGRQALLEGAHRGIGVARVDVARLVAGEARRGVRGTVEDVAGGGEDRFAVLALRRAVIPRAPPGSAIAARPESGRRACSRSLRLYKIGLENTTPGQGFPI
jgi:hypothetical protein